MSFESKIEGFDEVNHFLKGFSKSVKKEILEKAGKQAGKLVKDEIVSEMGRAFNAYSGRLHRPTSISVIVKAKGDEVVIQVGPKEKYFYAFFLEFGRKNMEPRPFMRPAFDRAAPKVLDFFRNKVMKNIKGRWSSRR